MFKFRLKSLRDKCDWEIDEERHKFLRRLVKLFSEWKGQLPNLRDFLRTDRIDWLLKHSIRSTKRNQDVDAGERFIEFVARTGYKDVPELDEDGESSSRRTTAVHVASRCDSDKNIIDELFKIFNKFDVNYTDELGLTHFHVACEYGCEDVVQQFVELVPRTGDSPLHSAVKGDLDDEVESLLRRGADPNVADHAGSTPLHVISVGHGSLLMAEMLFQLSCVEHRPINVDARDKLGRTPLELAVASLMPDMVEFLLDRGADLSRFIFPTERHFAHATFDEMASWPSGFTQLNCKKIMQASALLDVVESLERGGYELCISDVLTIIKLFIDYELFEMLPYVDEEFTSETRRHTENPGLLIFDHYFRNRNTSDDGKTARIQIIKKPLPIHWQRASS